MWLLRRTDCVNIVGTRRNGESDNDRYRLMNDRHVSFGQERGNRLAWWIGGALVATAIAAACFHYIHKTPAAADIAATAALQAPPAPEADAENAVLHPVPAQDSAAALPALAESDHAALGELAGIIGRPSVDQFMVPEGVIKRMVVTIDNLSSQRLAVERRPAKRTAGRLVVEEHGDVVTLSAENYARYTPIISVVRAADPASLAAAYFRFYPLFQQAYEELGYNGKYFNDRVVEVIDHLLQTPEVPDPIRLVQPSVFYKFEDPELEARSAGQKILIRMGGENARVIKQKLRELRAHISATKAPQGAAQ